MEEVILDREDIVRLIDVSRLLKRLSVPIRSDYVQYLIDNQRYVRYVHIEISDDGRVSHKFLSRFSEVLHTYHSTISRRY